MARNSSGPRNEPQYAGTGAPADAADLTELGAYAARQGNVRVDTRANRLLATGADLYNGLFWSETDTGIVWRYDGAAWRLLSPGPNLVKPTSVTGGTIGATGAVTFSGASTLSLNGIFSSLFDNYLIKVTLRAMSASSVFQGRLRVAGVDASGGTDYSGSIIQWDSSASGGQTGSISYMQFNNVNSAGGSKMDIEINDPAVATGTIFTSAWAHRTTAAAISTGLNSGAHQPATAYDGITFFPSSGTVDGTIRVYGYAN